MKKVIGRSVTSAMVSLCLLEGVIFYLTFVAALHGPAALASSGWTGIDQDALLLTVATELACAALGSYRPHAYARYRAVVVRALVAGAISLPIVVMTAAVSHITFGASVQADPLWLMQVILAGLALLVAARCAYSAALQTDLMARRVVIVGQGQEAARLLAAVGTAPNGLFRAEAAGTMRQAVAMIGQRGSRRAWGVVVADACGPASRSAGLVPPRVTVMPGPAFWDRQLGRVDVVTMRPHDPRVARPGPLLARAAHRLLDIAVATCLLTATLPVLLLTALAIRVESPGPVIYRQTRLGRDGVPFAVLKLRSMRVDAESGGAVWAMVRDPRVTRVGRVIRRLRIDELPQLLNVLGGTMSMVGPRPERPCFAAEIARAEPCFSQRTLVRPGLTGWAQVNHPYCASAEDAAVKLSYDLWYLRHRSVLLDILILVMTVRVVLFQEGSR